MQRLPDGPFERLDAAIAALAEEPRPPGAKKLTGVPAWRVRVGAYRVIYTIFDADRVVSIGSVARRSTTTYRKR